MPSVTNFSQYPIPPYTSTRSLEEGQSLSFKKSPTSYKPLMKAASLGTMALLGTAGICFVRKFFASNSAALSQAVRTELDTQHRLINARAIPTALPLVDQVTFPGTLFQVNHQFFTEVDGEFIQQKITQGPSWLSSQINPIVSSYNKSKNAYGIQIEGTTAYVSDYSGGLQIINVTSPNSPTLIGTYPLMAYQAQVVGNIAYVAGESSGLVIINITTPSSPTLIGSYPGDIRGVQIARNIAYLVDGSRGFMIIDVSTPSSPTLIGNYPSALPGFQVVDNIAYVSAGGALCILDLSTPSTPTLIGTFNTPGGTNGVQVVGSIAYVTDGTSLQIVNVSTPSTPIRIGSYKTPGNIASLQVKGTTAYLADSGSGLYILDIATPKKPTLLGFYDTPGNALGVHVVEATAYVADGSSGLQILRGLNRLTLLGTPSSSDRRNYIVNIVGTTAAGTTSTSFTLSVGGELPPVYQNPISLQNAMVDQSFNYVMPDNVFVDPNADVMTYEAQDLPQWLKFNAESRTFSGQPTPGDTNTYASRSTTLTIIAKDGRLDTKGQFTVTVTGESYLAKVIKIVGPTLSAIGMVYSGYKNRALFLNPIAKRKWKNNQMRVKMGENFMYALKTNVQDVCKIQAYVIDKGWLAKVYEKILTGKKRYVEFAFPLPNWMGYNTEVHVLHAIRKLEEKDFRDYQNIQIRVLGSGSVIQEVLNLEFESDAMILNNTQDFSARQEHIGLLMFPPTMTNEIEMEGIENTNLPDTNIETWVD